MIKLEDQPLFTDTGNLWIDHVKPILTLAWPLILANASMTMLMAIDSIMVGQYSGQELAYMAAGRAVVGLLHAGVFGLLSGVMVFVAQAYGAGRKKLTGIIYRAGLGNAIIVSMPIALFALFAIEPLLLLMGLEDKLAVKGADYAGIAALGLVPGAMIMVSAQFLEGLSRVKAVMAISLAVAGLNVIFNAGLIYGFGPLPELGAVGAAWGSLIAEAIGFVAFYQYMKRNIDGKMYGFGRRFRILWRHGRRLWKFGIPIGIATTAEMLAFSILTLLTGTMGDNHIAAFEIYFNGFYVPATFMIGFAGAVAIRVGHAVGAKRVGMVKRLPMIGSMIAVAVVFPYCIFCLLFPEVFARAFTQDDVIIDLASLLIPLLFFGLVLDAIFMAHMRAVFAVGDANGAASIQLGNQWLIMMPVVYVLVYWLDFGLQGFGLAIVASMVTGTIWSILRFRWITRDGSPFLKQAPVAAE